METPTLKLSLENFKTEPHDVQMTISEDEHISLIVKFPYLKNYPTLCEKQEIEGNFISPSISSEPHTFGNSVGKPSTWQILVNPCFYEKGRRYISCLLLMRDSSSPVDVFYEFKIIDSIKGIDAYSKCSGLRRFTMENNMFGWDKFLEFERLGEHPPPTIDFAVSISIHSSEVTRDILSSFIGFYFPFDVSFYQVPQSHCRDNINNDKKGIIEPMETSVVDKNRLNSLNKLKQKAWNNGSPNYTDTTIICKDEIKFPVHADIISAKSEVIASYLAKMDGFAPQPFEAKEIDSEVMKVIIEYCYLEDPLKLNGFGGTNTWKRMKLWDAVVVLKMRELEALVSKVILTYCVDIGVFRDVFTRYCIKTKSFENREATKTEFIGELGLPRDYYSNQLNYAKLIFAEL